VEESYNLFNESVMSNVEISPSLFDYSMKLNKNVNHHVQQIKKLKKKQSELLNTSDPCLDAEKYYAKQNIFNSRFPENISKWSQIFQQGSGSETAQTLIHQDPNFNPNLQNSALKSPKLIHPPPSELPIVERKHLIQSNSAVDMTSQPHKSFLGSYRASQGLAQNVVPLLTKKVTK